MLSLEPPDFTYFFRSAGGSSCTVTDRTLTSPFIVAPESLIDWSPSAPLNAADLEPILALNPEVILLGTGADQVFPPLEVLKHCASRKIGLEVMNNASAARTYNILAAEGRQVVAALIVG